MTIKHSKYKNTGILFELLVRQIASDVMAGKESSAVKIVKKYFTNTELAKEQKLYHSVLNSDKLDESKADLLLNTVLDLSLKLDEEKINKEKYSLIREIKKHYDLTNFFKNKINNYKTSAAIYTLFEIKKLKSFTTPDQILTNKITLLEHITKSSVNSENVENTIIQEFKTQDKDIRILTYRILIEKFNNKYSNLSDKQKLVLKEYISNISNVDYLRRFVNKNLTEIRENLIKLKSKVDDKTVEIKLQETINLIKPLSKKQIVKDEHLITLLQYHELVNELSK
jgi:hypothetical protein